MGGRQSKHASLFDEKQWNVINPNQQQLFTNVNTYASRALRNNRTNQEIEEYQLEFASESEYLFYGKELRLRKEPSSQEFVGENNNQGYYYLSQYIYTIKSFVNDTVEDMCSTVYKARLYAQKVDLRLKEINDIPFPDQLYLTKATLEGFKVLYEKMGFFDICEEMIFINKLGQVKVWIHPNLSMNHPYYYPSNSREPQGSQADMIMKLLDIIEENTDQYNHETLHFRDYLLNKNIYDRLSFYKALEEFQLYCVEEQLRVDESMQSIYELYHPEEEDQEVFQAPSNRYHLAAFHPEPNQRQTTPSRQKSYTPIKQKQLQIGNDHHPVKVSSPTTNNLLYNSHASNKNIRSQQVSNRPQFQSVEKNVYPSNNMQPPNFGNLPNLHLRRNSNLISTQHLQNSRHIVAGPPKPPSAMNKDSFRPASQQHNSARGNTLVNIQRAAQQSKFNHIVKFNYGSSSGVIPPITQIKPAQNHPPIQSYSQNRPPFPNTMQTNLHFTQLVPVSKEALAEPARKTPIRLSDTLISQQPFNRLPNKLHTLKSIQTDSVPSVIEPQQKSSGGSKVTYYSANEVYNLDSEIASDLEAFLGYNART